MNFFDTYTPTVQEKPENLPKPPPIGLNDLTGECDECGEMSDDILLGLCAGCAGGM